jgi:hypothetical protein
VPGRLHRQVTTRAGKGKREHQLTGTPLCR